MTQERSNFLLGLFIGLAIVAIAGFFVLLGVYLKGQNNQQVLGETVQQPANQPTNQANQAAEPTADATKLAAVTKDDQVRGDFNAPVTIILFSDFECPYCARFEDTLKQVLSDYAGKVRLVFRQFPLSFHPDAPKAAEASECAGEQGKFWEMHDKIFAANTSGTMSVDAWKTAAKELGLNVSKFNQCLDSDKYAAKIQQNYEEGVAAGVSGTPASFINGQFVSGALPYEQIKQIIDSKLE